MGSSDILKEAPIYIEVPIPQHVIPTRRALREFFGDDRGFRSERVGKGWALFVDDVTTEEITEARTIAKNIHTSNRVEDLAALQKRAKKPTPTSSPKGNGKGTLSPERTSSIEAIATEPAAYITQPVREAQHVLTELPWHLGDERYRLGFDRTLLTRATRYGLVGTQTMLVKQARELKQSELMWRTVYANTTENRNACLQKLLQKEAEIAECQKQLSNAVLTGKMETIAKRGLEDELTALEELRSHFDAAVERHKERVMPFLDGVLAHEREVKKSVAKREALKERFLYGMPFGVTTDFGTAVYEVRVYFPDTEESTQPTLREVMEDAKGRLLSLKILNEETGVSYGANNGLPYLQLAAREDCSPCSLMNAALVLERQAIMAVQGAYQNSILSGLIGPCRFIAAMSGLPTDGIEMKVQRRKSATTRNNAGPGSAQQRHDLVLQAIQEEEGVRAGDILPYVQDRLSSVSIRDVHNSVYALQKRGEIERAGPARGDGWRAVKKEKN